jgi:hypothetical protein
VDTGIASANFAAVTCNAGDGRSYTTGDIGYPQPNATVICVRSSAGSYFKYIGEASCCGDITIDYSCGG